MTSCAIIITAKDAAATIGKAVASGLAQAPAAEIVVVDDGSKDATAQVAASVDDGSGRLKIIRLEVNQGPSKGRNIAIAASTAPLICVLDADDFMSNDRLETLLARGGEGWDLLADDMFFTTGPSEDLVFDRLLTPDIQTPMDLTISSFARGNLPRRDRHRRELGFLKPLMRRAFLEQHGFAYDERLRLGEDMVLYSQCLLAGGRFRLVEACGYYAIERPDSLSGSHRTADIEALVRALDELADHSRAAGRDIGDLALCQAASHRNMVLRQFLDAKKAGGLGAAAKVLFGSPADALHITTALAHAKLVAPFQRGA